MKLLSISKPVIWIGSTLEDIRAFPDNVKKELGHDLNLIQHGLEPRDFKPMPNLGAGIFEIRVRENSGAYRLVYVAKFANAIYCLHAFQKKTQKTAPKDVEIIRVRYKAIQQGNF